jgi:glycosyltransferase involved in cell wall biosynthesis
MKKIAIVTNGINWITEHNPLNGGSNVVGTNFFQEIKNDFEIIIITSGENKDYTENNISYRFINYPLNSEEFKEEYLKISENCSLKIMIGIGLHCIGNGLLLETHSYQYRANSTFFLFRWIKRFLYRKKINIQKNKFNNISENDIFFAVSNNIKQDYKKNFNIKNIIVSHLGCKQVSEHFQANFNSKFTLGIVAGSSINKGAHFFILALGIAKILGLKFNLKIISPKYNKDFLMKILLKIFNMNKQTEILPAQQDMNYFYSSIDCLVMPSINEAFGLVPLEAMSYGKMCLVSNTIGFVEILKENCAFIFNRGSIFSLIKSLEQIEKLFYCNKSKFVEICKNGYELSKEYSWKNFAARILEVEN